MFPFYLGLLVQRWTFVATDCILQLAGFDLISAVKTDYQYTVV